MPTDAERLAVAEEIIGSKPMGVKLHDVEVVWVHGDSPFRAYRTGTPCTGLPLSYDYSIVNCILKARAKLAAEKEAALPEEAKRWRAALEEIVNCGLSTHSDRADKQKDIARKALEQGA